MTGQFLKVAEEIGATVEEKNEAYGSSFSKAGSYLALLYPDGIRPEQYADALVLVRIFDKTMRIANRRDAFGESPYRDLAGYGILGATMHEQQEVQSNAAVSAHGLPQSDQAQRSEVLLHEVPAGTVRGGQGEPGGRGDLRGGRPLQAVPQEAQPETERPAAALAAELLNKAELMEAGIKLMLLQELAGCEVWVSGRVGSRVVMSHKGSWNQRAWLTRVEAIDEAIHALICSLKGELPDAHHHM